MNHGSCRLKSSWSEWVSRPGESVGPLQQHHQRGVPSSEEMEMYRIIQPYSKAFLVFLQSMFNSKKTKEIQAKSQITISEKVKQKITGFSISSNTK